VKKGISGGHERHSGSDPSENFEQPKAQPFDEAAEVVAGCTQGVIEGLFGVRASDWSAPISLRLTHQGRSPALPGRQQKLDISRVAQRGRIGQQASSDASKREMSLVIVAAKSGILAIVPYDDTVVVIRLGTGEIVFIDRRVW
jgi:hypothetical protein